jgi:hypothetical protein
MSILFAFTQECDTLIAQNRTPYIQDT